MNKYLKRLKRKPKEAGTNPAEYYILETDPVNLEAKEEAIRREIAHGKGLF